MALEASVSVLDVGTWLQISDSKGEWVNLCGNATAQPSVNGKEEDPARGILTATHRVMDSWPPSKEHNVNKGFLSKRFAFKLQIYNRLTIFVLGFWPISIFTI